MEAIKTYLDNVFAAYPQTDELQLLKRDMLANMEEKYIALRQGGKSEHEAAYSVIADFGNIEEITTELGLGVNNDNADGTVYVSFDEAKAYLAKSKQSGILVGLCVWLIIAGVSSFVAETTFLYTYSMAIMFSAIAVAVVMLIVNVNRMGAYKSYGKTPIRLDIYTRSQIGEMKRSVMQYYTISLCIGVVVILFAVLFMTGEVAFIGISPALFLVLIGFSVFLFTASGMYKAAFDILLGSGDSSYKAAVKKSGRIIGTIAAIYWPIVMAIAMWQLFAGNIYFWVVWPVAGVLFGGICGGVAVWFGMKGKENG